MMTMKRFVPVLLFCFSVSSFAQNNMKYSGMMKMTEKIMEIDNENLSCSGEGSYEYYVDREGKRVKNGSYYFINDQEKSKNSLSVAHALMVKGQFVDGRKEGEWTVHYGTETYSIHYLHDQLDGEMVIQYRREPSNRVVCSFREDQFRGPFKCDGFVWVLSGQFDDDGFADGTWTLTPKDKRPYSYTYVFSNGAYVKSFMYDDSTGENTPLKEDDGTLGRPDIFGPLALKNYDNVFYIGSYLYNLGFHSVFGPFLSEDKLPFETVGRSWGYPAYDVRKSMAQKAVREQEELRIMEQRRREDEELMREKQPVRFDGNLGEVILAEVLPKLPRISLWKSFVSATDGNTTIFVAVSSKGKVLTAQSGSHESDDERAVLIREEAIKAAKGLDGDSRWIPGDEGQRFYITFHHYATGEVSVQEIRPGSLDSEDIVLEYLPQ